MASFPLTFYPKLVQRTGNHMQLLCAVVLRGCCNDNFLQVNTSQSQIGVYLGPSELIQVQLCKCHFHLTTKCCCAHPILYLEDHRTAACSGQLSCIVPLLQLSWGSNIQSFGIPFEVENNYQ